MQKFYNLELLFNNNIIPLITTPFLSEFLLFLYLLVILLICVCVPQKISDNLFFFRQIFNSFQKIFLLLIILNSFLLLYSNDSILTTYFYESYLIQNFSIIFFKVILFIIFFILLGHIKLFLERFRRF